MFQLHDFDMCIAKNEEALRVDPHFAECYGNMANAWKVCFYHVHGLKDSYRLAVMLIICAILYLYYRRKAISMLQFAIT